jgi:hypothetical protein
MVTLKGSISIGGESLKFFLCSRRRGVLAGFTTRWQSWWNMAWTGNKKVFCVLKLPKPSQLWWCNGGFRPHTTENHLQTKQFVSGTWNSSRVAVCALWNEQAGCSRPVHFAAHMQPPVPLTNCFVCRWFCVVHGPKPPLHCHNWLYWKFMYHSRIVLSIGGSVWYVIWKHRCTVTIDSVLANFKTQNTFLFPVHAMFHHDCLLAVKPTSMPWCLAHIKTWRDSLPIHMLPFGVTIPATVPQR